MFDANCRRCKRLANFLDDIKQQYPHYHARPVDAFGAKRAQLLIVGLAPGMHGANASGRPFTGDASGELLYQTLFQFGFANKPESRSVDDSLKLKNCRITNAVKCLPPQNKPLAQEVRNCGEYLRQELQMLKPGTVVLALGAVAHNAILRVLRLKLSEHKFAHGAQHVLPDGLWLIDSYHCSRYNTQTKRLTPEMFNDVFAVAKQLMGIPSQSI